MISASLSPGISLINDLSIFNLSIGKYFKCDKEEYPVPKSSIAKLVPYPCNVSKIERILICFNSLCMIFVK